MKLHRFLTLNSKEIPSFLGLGAYFVPLEDNGDGYISILYHNKKFESKIMFEKELVAHLR